jgi:hypothetical protein
MKSIVNTDHQDTLLFVLLLLYIHNFFFYIHNNIIGYTNDVANCQNFLESILKFITSPYKKHNQSQLY